jgi:hypothetical protein
MNLEGMMSNQNPTIGASTPLLGDCAPAVVLRSRRLPVIQLSILLRKNKSAKNIPSKGFCAMFVGWMTMKAKTMGATAAKVFSSVAEVLWCD